MWVGKTESKGISHSIGYIEDPQEKDERVEASWNTLGKADNDISGKASWFKELHSARAMTSWGGKQRDHVKNIEHFVISFPDEDKKKSADRCREIAEEVLQGLGYTDLKYCAAVHGDTKHQHIHIITTCVKEDFTLVNKTRDIATGGKAHMLSLDMEKKHKDLSERKPNQTGLNQGKKLYRVKSSGIRDKYDWATKRKVEDMEKFENSHGTKKYEALWQGCNETGLNLMAMPLVQEHCKRVFNDDRKKYLHLDFGQGCSANIDYSRKNESRIMFKYANNDQLKNLQKQFGAVASIQELHRKPKKKSSPQASKVVNAPAKAKAVAAAKATTAKRGNFKNTDLKRARDFKPTNKASAAKAVISSTGSIVEQIGQVMGQLDSLQPNDPQVPELVSRLESLRKQLREEVNRQLSDLSKPALAVGQLCQREIGGGSNSKAWKTGLENAQSHMEELDEVAGVESGDMGWINKLRKQTPQEKRYYDWIEEQNKMERSKVGKQKWKCRELAMRILDIETDPATTPERLEEVFEKAARVLESKKIPFDYFESQYQELKPYRTGLRDEELKEAIKKYSRVDWAGGEGDLKTVDIESGEWRECLEKNPRSYGVKHIPELKEITDRWGVERVEKYMQEERAESTLAYQKRFYDYGGPSSRGPSW